MIIVLATGLHLGSLHALDADHLVAVSAFAARRPTPRAAAGFGLHWAVGHGGVLLALGIPLVLLGMRLPGGAEPWLERAVGLGLIGLGVWTMASGPWARRHRSGPPGSDACDSSAGSTHGRAATAVGVLHGLAGTGPALALLPLATLESAWAAGAYLTTFALGTALAMGLYATLAGWLVGRVAGVSRRLARCATYAGGILSAAVGVAWLFLA